MLRSCLGEDDFNSQSNRRRLPVVTMDRKYKGPRVSVTRGFVTVGEGRYRVSERGLASE